MVITTAATLRLRLAQKRAHVDNHTDSNQEIGNKQGVTHKLEPDSSEAKRVVSNGLIRDHHEGTRIPSSPASSSIPPPRKTMAKYKDELHDVVFILPEKPAADTGKEINNQENYGNDFQRKLHRKKPSIVPLYPPAITAMGMINANVTVMAVPAMVMLTLRSRPKSRIDSQ